jgi:hypothetical protein
LLLSLSAAGQAPSSSPRPKSPTTIPSAPKSALDPGTIANGVYTNKMLGLICKIPEGWVLRTAEMNAIERVPNNKERTAPAEAAQSRVLLAAFSRPPEARGEEVNASILIAAEPVSRYPGLTEAVQYFEPLTEVANARGFAAEERPYAIAIGGRVLVRGDFRKDIGTRVIRQSTLALLEHDYAVSITIIAGSEDAVQELIDGLDSVGKGSSSQGRK